MQHALQLSPPGQQVTSLHLSVGVRGGEQPSKCRSRRIPKHAHSERNRRTYNRVGDGTSFAFFGRWACFFIQSCVRRAVVYMWYSSRSSNSTYTLHWAPYIRRSRQSRTTFGVRTRRTQASTPTGIEGHKYMHAYIHTTDRRPRDHHLRACGIHPWMLCFVGRKISVHTRQRTLCGGCIRQTTADLSWIGRVRSGCFLCVLRCAPSIPRVVRYPSTSV